MKLTEVVDTFARMGRDENYLVTCILGMELLNNAECYLFARDAALGSMRDNPSLWVAIQVLRDASRDIRHEIACSIGARLQKA
jgi:hypothetical protein